MIDNNLHQFGFQNFYISRQESRCPLIPRVVTFLNKLMENHTSFDLSIPLVSACYGKRIIINSALPNTNKFDNRDFLEIVDYDHTKHTYLLIGLSEPPIETPLHWTILNAKKEINVLLQIRIGLLNTQLSTKYPKTSGEYVPQSLENIGEILKLMRNKNCIVMENNTILCAGFDLQDVESLIYKILEEKL